MKRTTEAMEKAFFEACNKNNIKTSAQKTSNNSAKVIDKSGIERILTIENKEIKATAIPCFEMGISRFPNPRAKRVSGLKNYKKYE